MSRQRRRMLAHSMRARVSQFNIMLHSSSKTILFSCEGHGREKQL